MLPGNREIRAAVTVRLAVRLAQAVGQSRDARC
jgi:hypothetical protein